MHLSNLIAPTEGALFFGEDRHITGIASDSREVKEGFLFIAVTGTKKNGQDFIPDALKRGAAAVLSQTGTDKKNVPDSVTLVTVEDVRLALSKIASRFYPHQPSVIAAVTGTSGKTSTVQFTRELWEQSGHKAASIGTLGLITQDIKRYGSLTTPDPITLHQTIDETALMGVTHLCMEASSHGIELGRLDHVDVSVAAFTNLSRDHLDYHETMENYLAAKLRLFTTLLKENGTAVLNADIPEYQKIKDVCAARNLKVLSFGKEADGNIKLLDHKPEGQGQRLWIELFGKPYDVLLPLIGSFQAANSLCALAIAIASGQDPEKTVVALSKLSGVSGRLELIGTTPSGGSVFVDYAHKPAALEHVLKAMRPHVAENTGARLHVIFGCGGNRDKGKRPLMGKISEDLADRIIVTDDNPRQEQADVIRQEILAGCKKGPNLREIGNRAEAIRKGINDLAAHDVLVIAGKGHEEGQLVGDKVLPFNDATVARTVLKELE